MAGPSQSKPNTNRKKHNQRQGRPSRLQKQAPAALKVTPVSSRCVQDWKVAIPLLTPLILSPVSPNEDRTAKEEEETSPNDYSAGSSFSFNEDDETVVVSDGDRQIEKTATPSFMTWQHPAAPFYYDSSPLMTSFVHQCR
ncbi:hypothetical protein ACHQM5_027253 [Ranunculus cassubicifolius]